MDYYCNINNNEIKYLQNENLKEYLDGGPIICSSYFTYRCPMDSDDEASEYNGETCGYMIPQESTNHIDYIIVFDKEKKELVTAIPPIFPYLSGGCDTMIDVSSCRNNISKLYFTFKLWKENTYISFFNRRNNKGTPKKRFKEL